MASKIFLGSKPLTAEEMVAVCTGAAIVAVDDAIMEKITNLYAKTPVDKTPAVLPPAPTASSPSALLSPLLSRALLLGLSCQSLSSPLLSSPLPSVGRGAISPALSSHLLSLLNADAIGSLPLPSPLPSADAAADATGGFADVLLGALAGAYNAKHVDAKVPIITVADVYAVRAATGPAACVAAVAAFALQSAVAVSDVAVALTLECMQGFCEPFDAEANDALRNLGVAAGLSLSATNVRLLVEGSRRLGKSKTPAALHDAVLCAAQINGPAIAPVAAAVRVCAAEANAALPCGPLIASGKDAKDGVAPQQLHKFHAQPLLSALTAAINAANSIIAASQARVGALTDRKDSRDTKVLTGATTNVEVAASVQALYVMALQTYRAFELLHETLAIEASAAEAALCALEVETAKDAAAKEERRLAAAAERARIEAEKLAAMSADERKKFEDDQAKKREKAARKEKADAVAAAAQGAGAVGEIQNPLSLGAGIAEFRTYARSAALAAGIALPAVGAASVAPHDAIIAAFRAVFDPLGAYYRKGDSDAAVARVDVFLKALIDRVGSGGAKRKAKIAKGARDFMPEQMEVREKCFNIIRSVFKRHGAVEIDTPVFELRETLLGKYGEEGGKLIYDLADQGGELLCLRYDLTVPFARFIGMHGITNIKRYHIARVYRRDNPQMNRGRFREFYQCDFDIAGNYAPMMADAEVLTVASQILSSLPIGGFTIKLNHRGVLDAVLEIAGVPASKFRPICSAIDKLDKEPWAVVKEEMVVEKGLTPEVADKIGHLVQRAGAPDTLLPQLFADPSFSSHAGALAALNELATLFKYLRAMGSLPSITFDLSLARGLDYYTGVIYEAVLTDPSVGVGSIAAGGRYDNLVGMFAPAGTVVPCVGVSIGVERVFAIMESRAVSALARTPVSVLVASIPSAKFDMNEERMKICNLLWAAGISAEMVFAVDPKLQKQVTAAAEGNIPYMIVVGEDELVRGEVQVKNMQARTAANIPIANIAEHITSMMSAPAPTAAAVKQEVAAAPILAAPASVGTVIEGTDRAYGRFARPAKAI